MKGKQFISGVAVALLTVGCGYGIKASTDFDKRVRFANYDSFFIVKGNSSGNPLMDQRAQADVRSALMRKGWIEVPEGKGQTAVVVHATTTTKHTYAALYEGWGGWNWPRDWGQGGGGLTPFVNDYKAGTLVVDIFDSQTKQPMWHGTATDALSDNAQANADATKQAVDKMFHTFPPMFAVASLP